MLEVAKMLEAARAMKAKHIVTEIIKMEEAAMARKLRPHNKKQRNGPISSVLVPDSEEPDKWNQINANAKTLHNMFHKILTAHGISSKAFTKMLAGIRQGSCNGPSGWHSICEIIMKAFRELNSG